MMRVEFLHDARKNCGDACACKVFLKISQKTVAALHEVCNYALETLSKVACDSILSCASLKSRDQKFFDDMKNFTDPQG